MRKQCFAMLLVLCLLFGLVASAEQSDDPILATVNGKAVLQSEVVSMAENLAYYGMLDSATNYVEALDYIILNQMVARIKVEEYGFDVFTEEEMTTIQTKANEEYERYLDIYVSEKLKENTSESREKLREEGIAYWDSYGCTRDYFLTSFVEQSSFERLYDVMDLSVTEEEISAVIEQSVAKDQAYFEGNIKAFEYYTHYLDYDIWYMPTGYRGINDLFLSADPKLLETYEQAMQSGDETAITKAKQMVLDAKESIIQGIYERLEKGESFESVMLDVSENPNMTKEQAEEGFMIHRDSVYWTPGLAETAYEELHEVGDVSKPVVLEDGIHILFYIKDIPSGAVPVTDEMKASATEHLVSQKKAETLMTWKEACDIVYMQEAMDTLLQSVTVKME